MDINNNSFGFLRHFFALNILFAHLIELSQSKSLDFFFQFTDSVISLQGFFVISGFLIAKSYSNSGSLKEYFTRRAKRILPAYIFVVSLAAILGVLVSTYSFSEYFSNPGFFQYVGWNYIFLNFMQPCLPGVFENNLMCSVNGSLWTLKVEEGFYIVVPIIFYILKKTRKKFYLILLLYISSILYWDVMEFYFDKPLLAKQLPGYMSYFLTGIFIYLNFEFFIKNKRKIALIAAFFLLIPFVMNRPTSIFYPAALGTLVIVAAYSLPFLNNIGKRADFTYGLYIYHFPIIQTFRYFDLFEKYNPFLMAFAVLLLTTICAAFSWFVIEKRVLDRFKKQKLQEVNPILLNVS